MSRIPLTFDFVNLVVLTIDGVEDVAREQGGIAITDFCILEYVRLAGRSLKMSELESFLMLRNNTLSIATTRLESAGFMEKRSDELDLRKVSLVITPRGAEVSQRIIDIVHHRFTTQMWDESETFRIPFGMELDARAYLTSVGSVDKEFPKGYAALPEWIMGLKLLEQCWTAELRRECRLSLSEFRLLYLLCGLTEGIISRDASMRLGMERSAFSRVMSGLRGRSLLTAERSKLERRSFDLYVSESGRDMLAKACDALQLVTEQHYAQIPVDDLAVLSSWHSDMHREFMRNLGL